MIVKYTGTQPTKATAQSACHDVRSTEDGIVRARCSHTFSTGLRVQIPEGYELQVKPRSGLGFKHSVALINCIGVIDSDYRGDIKVCLINHSDEDYYVNAGDRIAQISLHPVLPIEWVEVQELGDTDRGEGGFGHSGR